jgi:hypothetical protein
MLTYPILKFVRFFRIMSYVNCTVTKTDSSNKVMSGNIKKKINQKCIDLILNFI